MNTPFKWENFEHFYNAARKRTREKIGCEVEPKELKEICHSLFRLSEELDLSKYANPTGFLINEIRQTIDLESYAFIIRKYQHKLSDSGIEHFKNTLLIKEKVESEIGVDKKKPERKKPDLMPINDLVPLKGDKKSVFSFDGLLPNKPGVYFLFDADKNLVYIGKSTCLSNRVPSSFSVRKAKHVKLMITDTKADAHILEPYCISVYAPPLNAESNTGDMPTFRLELPPLSDFIEPKLVYEHNSFY